MIGRKWFLSVWLVALLGGAAAYGYEDEITIRTVLFPLRQAILSAAVETTVESIDRLEGESFEAGDVLIALNDDSFRQRVLRAEANLDQAKQDLIFAEKNLERSTQLHKAAVPMISDQEYDKAVLDRNTKAAQKKMQEAELEIARRDLDNCQIRAPFSGRMAKRLIQPSEYVRPGQALMQVLDDTKLLCAMHLPSFVRSRVKIGDTLEIAIDDRPGQVYSGQVYELSGDIDAASRTFELKLLIDNPAYDQPEERLIAGMSGRLLSNFDAPEAQTP